MGKAERWLVSVAGGVLIPLGYAVLVGQSDAARADDAFGLLFRLPVTWPTYVCDLVYAPPFDFDEELHGFRGVEAHAVSIVAGNVIAYTLLTYAFVSRLAKTRWLE